MSLFWKRGEPLVWMSGAALAAILIITVALIAVVVANGIGVFWPHKVILHELTTGDRLLGEVMGEEVIPNSEKTRRRFKVGNRELYGLDFRWVDDAKVTSTDYPEEVVVLERTEYGNFYGFLTGVTQPTGKVEVPGDTWEALQEAEQAMAPRVADVQRAEDEVIALTHRMERLERRRQKLEYRARKGEYQDAKLTALEARQEQLRRAFSEALTRQQTLEDKLADFVLTVEDANGRTKDVQLAHVVRAYRPNQMSFGSKLAHYGDRLWELLTAEPREANTEGGLFPAIFGTIMLVFIMSILSFPMGVIAGIYLREYAKDGWLVRTVRIAVNNLAGIPSIVYGVFGLGFFVYGVGGTIDSLFFPERLPTPTFGTGGILWASLTLGILTIPVVIVSTEEAFGSIPRGIREASLALGATRLQTLWRVLLPMASPGILTGFILAMARAAGEVAPLMITGVVKLAPALPLDGQPPYLHLDRKFMHLGFHIYDIGFQSPNVEAAKPMVFVTTFLLVLIVLIMTSTAIVLRNHMRKKYAVGAF